MGRKTGYPNPESVLLSSTDAVNWTNHPNISGGVVNGVLEGDGTLLAWEWDYNGAVLSSLDALVWRQTASLPYLGGVAYGNGRFVAVSGMISSPQTTRQLGPTELRLTAMVHCGHLRNGKFIATGHRLSSSESSIFMSTGELDRARVRNTRAEAVAYGNGRFVASGYDPQVIPIVLLLLL
jgi:hypothetical protein